MEIGSRLKETRESKNISLEDVQHKTKIQTRYLQAIEKGEFDIMPGNFYIRAFIKEYAGAIGLDPDQLLKEHEEELPPPTVDKSMLYTKGSRSREGVGKVSKRSGAFSFLPGLIIAALIVGIVFAIWFFTQDLAANNAAGTGHNEAEETVGEVVVKRNGDPAADEETTEQESGERTASESSEGEPEQEKADPELELIDTGSQGNEETTVYSLINPSEEIDLQINTSSEHWLEITTASEKNIFHGMFNESNAPLKEDITGVNILNLRVGEPSEIEISIDGKLVEFPESADLAKIQQLTIHVESNPESN